MANSTPIDELSIEIDAKANDANSAIDNLCKKIDILTTSISGVDAGKLNSLSNGIQRLGVAAKGIQSIDKRSFEAIATKINELSAIDTSKFAAVSANLHQMANGIQSLGTVSANVASVGELAKNISKLGNKSVQTAISNIPQLATALNGLMTTLSQAPKVSQNVIQMTNALANLTAQGSKVGNASSSIVKGLNRTSSSAAKANKSFKGLASTFGRFYANCFLVIRGMKSLWGSIESTGDYIESFNYYTVSFGKIASKWDKNWENYGDENARNYSNSFVTTMNDTFKKLSGVEYNPETGLLSETGLKNLGYNLKDVTQYAAQLSSTMDSIGQSGETTLATTNAFVKLAGDLSSLYNIDYSSASSKLQSVLQGQSRAGYFFGWDTTVAALQATADKFNLSKPVSEMQQYEKQQLRILTILEQSRVAWGDNSNTINTFSNQLRTLKNNITEFGNILGQLFIPILSKVIPVINGAVIAMKRLFSSFASILGLEIKDMGQGYDDMSQGMDGISDSLDGVAESAEKAKAGVRGFDKLNVISTSSSGANTSGIGGGIDLTDEILKATSEYEKAWQEAYDRMQNRAMAFADKIEKSLEPIKKIFQDFTVGDFFQAGQDVSNLVVSITDFFTRAIDNVGWYEIGRKIGDFLAGIDWEDVLSSIGDLIWEAINASIELWKGSFDAAPIETGIISGIALLKWTGLGDALAKSALDYMGGKITFATLGIEILKFQPIINSPAFLEFGNKILDEVSDGIKDLTPNWAFELLSKIGAGMTMGALAGSWFPGAGTVAGAIIGAIVGALSGIKIDGKSILKHITDQLFNFDTTKEIFEEAKKNFEKGGLNIVLGVIEGFVGAFGFLVEPIKDLFDTIWGGICDVFGIHSPSEKMKPIGKNILLGIKEGFVGAFSELINAAKELWDNFASALNKLLVFEIEPIEIMGKTFFEGTTITLGKIPTFSEKSYSVNKTAPTAPFAYSNLANGTYRQLATSNSGSTFLNDIENTIKQTIEQERSNQSISVNVTLEGDANGLFKTVKKEANNYTRRTGNPAFDY